MPLNYVTVNFTFDNISGAAAQGFVSIAPTGVVTNAAGQAVVSSAPVTATLGGSGTASISIVAMDNSGLTPAAGYWAYNFTVNLNGQSAYTQTLIVNFANGATQAFTALPVAVPATAYGAVSTSSGFTNPMTTLGDLIYENATPAAARLAGDTSNARKFLRSLSSGGVATAPAWDTLLAADVPGVDGVTVTGTPTSGQVPTATSGSAATWQTPSAGLSAWQFQPETYGAARNGAFLYDAAMTSGSAVLTMAGLPAPSAPSVSNSGSGGTVLAGVYQVKITYVNRFGETVASSSSSTTTSGSTSSITVTSPAPWTNATGYYVYCTQAGGSTYTRQQAPGSPTPLRTSYTITAPPTNTGAAPPGADTSHSAPFSANDVGKAIIVPSAGGFLNVPLVTTIASFQSATQVTLAANATRTVTGSGAVYGTDDTAAIQSAINAAVAYAQTAGTEQATGEVVFSNGIYCVAGAPGGTAMNAQIQIPAVDPYVGPKVNLKLTGPQEALGPVHWEQPNPPAAGCTIASIYYSDSGSPPTPNPAVIGGPVTGYGGNGGLFSNMRVIVDGINVLVAYRCSISGLDLYGVGQADVRSFSYFAMARTLGASAGGWPPYISDSGNPSPWQCWGYRTPTTGNNAQNDCDRLTVYGPYHGVLYTDHFTADSVKCVFTFYATSANAIGTAHHCGIASLLSEATFCPVNNNQTINQAVTIGSLHCENATFIISDSGNALFGEVRAEQQGAAGLITGGKSGGANIRLIWDNQTLGAVASPPAVPSSTTAFVNQFWRDAVVIVTGGTVTVIAIDGKTTGLTSGPVRVRSGGTITLTYSAAPTWAWVLE